MYTLNNLKKLYTIINGSVCLPLLLIFMIYCGHVSLADLLGLSLSGTVNDVNENGIEGVVVRLNDESGVSRFDGFDQWITYRMTDGLASNYIHSRAIDTDVNHTKWFGTFGGGVSSFNGTYWTTYTMSNGLPSNDILSIAIDPNDGTKWFGTFGGGVTSFDGTTWTTYTEGDGLVANDITSIAIDTDVNHTKWFGTNGGGVTSFNVEDGWTPYTTDNGLASNYITSIAISPLDGTVWVGTNGGVSCFDGTTWTTYTEVSTGGGLVSNNITSIAIEADGTVWVGTNGGGVSSFNVEDGWMPYTTDNGLASNVITSIAIDSDNRKWFGTKDCGVVCYNDTTFTPYTMDVGLVSNYVNAIAIDPGDDKKWFGTGRSIYYPNCKRLDFKWKEIEYCTYEDESWEDYYIYLYSVWCAPNIGIVKEENTVVTSDGVLEDWYKRELVDHSTITPETVAENGSHEYFPLEESAIWLYQETYYSPGDPGNVQISGDPSVDVCLGYHDNEENGERYWGVMRDFSWLDVYRFQGNDVYEVWDDEAFGDKAVAHGGPRALPKVKRGAVIGHILAAQQAGNPGGKKAASRSKLSAQHKRDIRKNLLALSGGNKAAGRSAPRTVPKAGKSVPVNKILKTQQADGIEEHLFLRFGIAPGETYETIKEMSHDFNYVYEDFEYGTYRGEETAHLGEFVAITGGMGDYTIYSDTPYGDNYTLTASRYGFETLTQNNVTAGIGAEPIPLVLNYQTLLTGTVYDYIEGSTIEYPAATVNDGGERFKNCARFDFTWEEKDLDTGMLLYLGTASIWLASGVGMVKKTFTVAEAGEGLTVVDKSEATLIDYYFNPDNPLEGHSYLPFQEGAEWDYIEKREDYWRYVEYSQWDVPCYWSDPYWLHGAGGFRDEDDYIYVNSIDNFYWFLFGYLDGSGKLAVRAPAKAGKTTAVHRALRTASDEPLVFCFNQSAGFEWNVYGSSINNIITTVKATFAGIEPVTIADSRTWGDDGGHYSFLGIPANTALTVTASEYEYASSSVRNVTIMGGEEKTIDFTLMPMAYCQTIVNVAEAASMGFINQYCYTWNTTNGTGEYEPISVTDSTPISPWTGFWIASYYPTALFFPGNREEPSEVEAGDDPPGQDTFTVDPRKWYLISPPFCPTIDGTYIDINNAIGDELGIDGYEITWRIAKWWYDTDTSSFKYLYYNGQDEPLVGQYVSGLFPILSPFCFYPGKGFWLYYMPEDPEDNVPVDIQIESGTGYNPMQALMGSAPYALSLEEGPGGLSAYMTGNPYWFDIQWKDCQVVVDNEFLGMLLEPGYGIVPKIAQLPPDKAEKWHIRLKLESLDGRAVDTYNRAGVVMTEGVDNKYFWAYDLEPMGSYIRLMLKDPSDPRRNPLAYDYRASGLNEYTWEVDLTTTYPEIDARLSFADFDLVPAGFLITLKDTDTGKTYTIDGKNSFQVSLSSGKRKTFILTAINVKNSPSDSDETLPPAPFGIRNVFPNPFNISTTIQYSLEQAGNVQVKIYNISGQLVSTVVNACMEAGIHNVVWNAEGNSSGLYMVLLESNGMKDTRKMTLMK